MNKQITCNSCNVKIMNLTGSVIFKCPSCSETEIIRCDHCRRIVAKYHCSKCNFVGP
ncbi:MAG TPA: zinc finger domain-containing protein [Candidatus Nanoarchaeia archaeon]|nr:zinc finger domain-containing protein [Candidatus Nanoarchaeia archaeon]